MRAWTVWTAMLALACNTDKGGDESDIGGTGATCTDEVCDGVDNDCDGEVDEDAVDAGTWYADADGDGYGDAASAVTACEAPTGAVDNGEDCDDGDAAAYPGAPEVCDGVDDDCDGEVDEDAVDMGTWYTDADGDGYGDPDTAVEACEAPTGTVDNGEDCDDGDPNVNPGASESFDLADEDCDGLCDEGFIGAGDLVVTEFLAIPMASDPADGEWIEIANVTSRDIRICDGWTLEDAGGESHTIADDVLVPAGEVVVFGASDDPARNGGVTVDYAYSGFTLDDGDDEIYLRFDGTSIDEVEYDATARDWAGTIFRGVAAQLDPRSTDATANDSGSAWCLALHEFGDGDFGTPGDANDPCGGGGGGVPSR